MEIKGIILGRIKIRISIERPLKIQGASYKVLKTMIMENCPGVKRTLPPTAGIISISPLADKRGKYLFPYTKGWLVEKQTPPVYEVHGEYTATMSWVGDPAKNRVLQLLDCMKKSSLSTVDIEEILVERASSAPIGQVFIKLRTPAQYAYRPFWGKSVFLAIPSVSRILKPALQYIFTSPVEYTETAKDIDYYTGVIEGNWKPVTVLFDKKKSNAWSITGWARIVVSHKTPTRIMEVLGLASRILQYSGTGKSRLNGFGQVDVAIEA